MSPGVTLTHDVLLRNVLVLDGSGDPPRQGDVALAGPRIGCLAEAGSLDPSKANVVLDGSGLALAPGFIDVHSHDDISLIERPEMRPKISQGVTTIVVGNCGISAAPVTLKGAPPDPMNLLGQSQAFCYPTFAAYVKAVDEARPAVNVAALVGHTALRGNHLDRLDRAARPSEIAAMRAQLREALDAGALGLSTGLAYASAFAAPTEEITALAEPLAKAGALYCTHLRTEFAGILAAMEEAFQIGRQAQAPVIISHLKCAGVPNHGRSGEVLSALDEAHRHQAVGCDCYPYAASSSTLDLEQVTEATEIFITWSDPHPELGGKRLAEVAASWGVDLVTAARRLQPAGAIYHGMQPEDVERILAHPLTAIGSDGLPNDPMPHPRLWGTFPRVLAHYARERHVFSMAEAVRKMTGLSADRYLLDGRGYIRPGYWADLVLFDPSTIRDAASYSQPQQPAEGIAAVWVNGVLTWREGQATGERAGRFLPRRSSHSQSSWEQP
jgi:N-acyl-D-amino-acid deacylase